MGVDCRISLPSDVSIRSVADVIGIALHCPWQWSTIPSVDVSGVKIEASSVVGCADILIAVPPAWKEIDPTSYFGGRRSFFYHFEYGRGQRGLQPRSTATNIAIGKRLVMAFGGLLSYTDYDHLVDFAARPFPYNGGEDGQEWRWLQQRIADTKPLTREEIEACDAVAAYKLCDRM